MKLFRLANTPPNCWLPDDSIILVDMLCERPTIIIRTPWTMKREYYDADSFYKKFGPCRFTWAWGRKQDGTLIHVKQWIPVQL